ncbi:alpha/beta fold hydrolase [Lysinibacter cavernae]|uniref:Alpha-beta hydrolase superfamily lysophospholipase n=1 Tax=Lysinibacter cavernae TaxID=1640652 RepID=A0A7X5R029_9MICO|nr:alpha/beta hydrolase [Lysinibacter cavernae]NIH53146.1 alpha-beta hydrolase superfamily lysophospholipase [Lysinibacter cavernae]
MNATQTSFVSPADSRSIATYRWATGVPNPRGVVQIAHGAAEYGLRYDRLATALTSAGYLVYAQDHRGHGNSVTADAPLGSFGGGGWAALVGDISEFSRVIRAENPDLPLFLIAHSMGSMAAQAVILDHSELYDGVILSGSTAVDVLAAALPVGDDAAAGTDLSAFNAGFEQRTGFEWLSRDEAEVDKYVADPLCGFDLEGDLLQIVAQEARTGDVASLGSSIRHDLPILVVSGQADPLAGDGALVTVLANRYREAGLTDVTLQVYPEARHEIFNETNRDEITAFVIDWIEAHRSASA